MVGFQLLLSEPSEGALVLSLSGELDMGTVGPLADSAKAAISSGDYETLVFDLTRLTFIDSTGLQVLAQAHRGMTAAGGEVRIVCSDPHILRVFELTALDRMLQIVSDRSLAVAA
jgi:anti-sigma B factor antagonist